VEEDALVDSANAGLDASIKVESSLVLRAFSLLFFLWVLAVLVESVLLLAVEVVDDDDDDDEEEEVEAKRMGPE
jgi:hypothetical protein